MGWISSTFCLILHNTAEWGIRCIRPGNGVLACTVTQMKLCFFFHDTSLACSKKKTHYCSCGALFMKYLTSHSPNLCSNHSVFVWSIIWVHLGHVDSEGRNVAFIVFSLNNTFPSDQIQVNPTDWLMQLCFQVNLLLIKQVAQISERSKKNKKNISKRVRAELTAWWTWPDWLILICLLLCNAGQREESVKTNPEDIFTLGTCHGFSWEHWNYNVKSAFPPGQLCFFFFLPV